MSTSWSEMIYQFTYDGYSKEDIISYFGHPVVNDEYIDTVLNSRYRLLKKRGSEKVTKRSTVPAEGTRQRIVYDYAKSIGGIKKFEELLKTKTQAAIARELKVDKLSVTNFTRDYVRNGRRDLPKWLNNAPNLTMKIRSEQIQKGNYKKKPKRISIKDVRNLW